MGEHTVQPSTVRILQIFNFVMYGALAVYSTFFAIYLRDLGWSNVEIGALLAGGPVVALVANPIWGYWADRLRDNRRILVIALIGNFAVMQIVFSLREEALIYAGMLVFFLFQSPLFTQSSSLVLNVIDGTRHKFGAFRLWGSLGWALTAAAAGPLIGKLGIGRLWIVFDAMILIAIVSAFFLPRGGAKVAKAAKPSAFAGGKLSQVLMNRPFLLLLGLGVLVSVPNSFNQTFIGIYIQDLGGSASIVGWSTFATTILEAPVYLLLDRYMPGRMRHMIACLATVSALYALRWLLMGVADTAWSIIWIQLLHCVTFGGYYYIGTQLTVRLIPAAYRSTGQAVYALSWGGVSGIIAGVAGGWMFEHLGPHALYRISAGVALLGAIGFLLMMRSVPAREQETAA
ncbi:MFS transporter [Cohnella nanjingensis]|uniref:MFS transporter n=1 Tax=Cohnella nanjingensis TaxID=1387779 RepID=A0A7X0RSH6_9BACL|nr:MFS transporter [Cohnella nanjingensis]MBB6672726.1 MFS transporter [Cohnella nanjingensis]